MSASAIARLAGFRVLLAHSGETLYFRGASLTAVVNRSADDRKVRTADFEPRDMSEIELLTSAVNDLPRPGEAFEDLFGLMHRIETVRRTDFSIRCRCETVEALRPHSLTDDGSTILTDDGSTELVG